MAVTSWREKLVEKLQDRKGERKKRIEIQKINEHR